MSVSRSDQVFQLSLTEIAFTVSFILLLLLGYLVFREQSERKAIEQKVADAKSAERATAAMVRAKSELQSALVAGGVPSAQATITRLVDAEKVRQEREELQRRLQDVDAKLTALTELQKAVDTATPEDRAALVQGSATDAIAFQAAVSKAMDQSEQTPSGSDGNEAQHKPTLEQVKAAIEAGRAMDAEARKQFGAPLAPSEVRSLVRDAKAFRVASKSDGLETAQKENSDLRGQVAYLKNRLNARGGRDYPPCWADESGKPQFLAKVELRGDVVSVTRDWQDERSADAAKLPGFASFVGKSHLHADFPTAAQPIFDWSRHQDPECRHYVWLRSTISDAVQSDRARLMVERFFYKSEARR